MKHLQGQDLKNNNWKKQIKNVLLIALILGIFSIIITLVSMYYSTGTYGIEMFKSYLEYKKLIFFHVVPVFCVSVIVYLISNSLAFTCGCTGALFLILTWINYFKLQFRDDPFLFGDIFIAAEAKNMTGHYKIELTGGMIFWIIMLILIIVGLVFVKVKISIKSLRIILLAISVCVSGILYKTIYCDSDIYNGIENYDLVNRWGDTQQFISRGFIYPFIYSISSAFPDKPENYNKKQAEESINEYEYEDIPEEKKVNVISVMLEAYNDFSKFKEVEFINNPYKEFHEIQKEGISGELTTNIFAGGTVNTERAFLTSYTRMPPMRQKTNTWVQYFKEQGYVTTGWHQCYGWFYNRKNINQSMGFDRYYYYEEGYSDYDINELLRTGDELLIEDIIRDYKKIISDGKKCFSFSVTYQNHGPYSNGAFYDETYIKRKDKYTEEEYNIANNYLEGISKTDIALGKMVEFFAQEEEPVVLILFGDHNPWLGDNNSVYEMLGINLDLGTEEGFYNYYNTPYVIWANDSAKKILDFSADTQKNLSSCFLMNKFFKIAGYTGNEYMQYSTEIYETIPLINTAGYLENGEFTRNLSAEGKEKLNEFEKIQYYWQYE